MKSIGVFYATREGHTKRIAEHVAARLRTRGLEVEMANVRDRGTGLERYDAVLLAASVHAGKHEREMVRFVRNHIVELDNLNTAFLSVTLSEAGAERADETPERHARFVADVDKMVEDFFRQTGWHPKHVKPVAGALMYSKYNILVRFVLKKIAKKAGAATDTSHDYDYTNWAALDRFVDGFADEISKGRILTAASADRFLHTS